METLIDLITASTATYTDRPALVCRSGLRNDVWSYQRLLAAVNAAAHYLRNEVGLKAGEAVLVTAANSPQLVACYLGAMLARIVLVPLDPLSTRDFVARVARETQSATLISGAPMTGLRHVALYDMPFDSVTSPFEEQPQESDIAEVVFTSGTTGHPKGVVLTHENILANVRSASRVLPKGRHWRFLSVLPMSHMFEQTVGLFLPLRDGLTIYYSTSRQSQQIVKALKNYRIAAMVAVPQILTHLLRGIERSVRERGKWRRWEYSHRLAEHLPMHLRRVLFSKIHAQMGNSFEVFVCGGAYLAPELCQTWERMGVKVVQGYGTTECSPVIACNSFEERMDGSVGRVLPGVEVRFSAEGEVQVKGKNVTPGYWHNKKATAEAFSEDGWYRTGDLAALDAEGHLHLKGRLKEMIVLPSGMNVFSKDIESVLAKHEQIKDCVVLGMGDDAGGVRITAVVLPADRGPDPVSTQQNVEAVVRAANLQLAPHQRVTQVLVWEDDDFPRTGLGKVKLHEVGAIITGQRASKASGALSIEASSPLGRLRHVLADVSGVNASAITMDTDLNLDLALDSLSLVELAVLLEKEFEVTVDDGELAKLDKVAQLAELTQKAPAAEPFTYPEWPLSPAVGIARTVLQRSLMFPIHSFCAHPFVVKGAEHLHDLTLPALFIANHNSHIDTISIVRALPSHIQRKLAVAAADDYFYRYASLGLAASLFLNSFPFSREGAVKASFEHCGELIDAGWSILIYPEGTRSPTGELLPFKRGIALLAMELGVSVVPIGMRGGHEILPKGHRLPRRSAVTLRMGQPVTLPHDKNIEQAVVLLREAVSRLMAPPVGCCSR